MSMFGRSIKGSRKLKSQASKQFDDNGLKKIHVKVIEGKNLAPKDSNGLADPYVKLRVGSSKAKTSTIPCSLNPVWTDDFYTLDVEDNEEFLEIEVWDYDKLSADDFMGQARVRLVDVCDGALFDEWLLLKPSSKKEKVKGHIHVQYVFPLDSAEEVTTRDFSFPLHAAMQKGNENAIKRLFESLPSGIVEMQEEGTGYTALHVAALYGRDSMIPALITRMARNLDVLDGNGKTALHIACAKSPAVALKLLSSGANPSISNKVGLTPLHVAATSGHEEVVEALLERGVEIDPQSSQGKTPLHLASAAGNEKVIVLLVNKGATVTIQDTEVLSVVRKLSKLEKPIKKEKPPQPEKEDLIFEEDTTDTTSSTTAQKDKKEEEKEKDSKEQEQAEESGSIPEQASNEGEGGGDGNGAGGQSEEQTQQEQKKEEHDEEQQYGEDGDESEVDDFESDDEGVW